MKTFLSILFFGAIVFAGPTYDNLTVEGNVTLSAFSPSQLLGLDSSNNIQSVPAQALGTFYSGPISGANAVPTFRLIDPADIPLLPASKIPQADATHDGYLSQGDWSTFNSKEPATTATSSADYYRGDKTFQTLDTLAVPENTNLYFTNVRAQGAVSASAPLVDISGVFSIPASTSSVDGYLSSADWTTFNNKFDLPSLTAGSILFSDGTTIAQDNSHLLWDNTNKILSVTGEVSASNSATDAGASAGIFSATSSTTVNGSNTTLGINGVASGTVATGAENDKEIGGGNFSITRGDGTDQGILDAMTGVNSLMFVNSDSAGVTQKAYGFSTLLFSQQGTVTDLYDFFSQRVPAGSGVVTNHYGIYIANDNDTPVKNWISGMTQIGGSGFSPTASTALDIQSTTGALAFPRMSTSDKNGLTASNGMEVYDTTLNEFDCYASGSWGNCGSGGGGGANTTLSNLGTTSINASLLFDTNNAYDVGSSTAAANNLWATTINGGAGSILSIQSYQNIDANGAGITIVPGTPPGPSDDFGGTVTITGGAPFGDGGGGNVSLGGGEATGAGNGGSTTVKAGGADTSGNGGSLNFQSGGSDTGNAGNINILANTNSANIPGTIKMIDGHVISKLTSTSPPTILVTANAGTGASSSIAGTDEVGQITLTTTAISPGSGDVADVTFNHSFANAPYCVFSPANTEAAAPPINIGLYLTATTTVFSLNFVNPDATGDTYIWNYRCTGTE